jgi:hypothetical protein
MNRLLIIAAPKVYVKTVVNSHNVLAKCPNRTVNLERAPATNRRNAIATIG